MRLSISPHFHNKENRAEKRVNKKTGVLDNRWAMGAFTTTELTAQQVADHIKSGKAICVAALDGDWRGEAHFISSQMMGIDFDQSPGVEKLIEDDFIRQYAFYVYPTPSHTEEKPRSRALFALDAALLDYKEYRILITRLLERFGQFHADPACKDPVRIFYGSDVPGKRGLNPTKVLPLDVLRALPKTEEEKRREEQAVRPEVAFKAVNSHEERRAQAYCEKARQRIIDEALANNVEGYRHHAFISAVWALVAKQKGGWIGFDATRDARFLSAAMERDTEEMESALRGAERKVDPDWFSLPASPEPRVSNYVSRAAEEGKPPPPPPPAVTWKTSDDAMDTFRDRLVTPRAGYLPLIFPFNALHPLSGMAHVIPAGVLAGIVGASGGLKTSFLETITDAWRKVHGVDVLWWGTEWSYEQMADRAVQRYGGPSMTDVMLHEIALAEDRMASEGGQVRLRRGKRLPQGMIELGQRISGQIENVWGGKAHYIEQPISDVETLLTAMHERTDEQRAAGRDVRIAVFDYLQLLDLYKARTESERITDILGKLKLFCQEKKLIGLVASQVTKTEAANMKEGNGLLAAESGQFVRSDKFNLVMTLNPVYDGGMLTDRGVINVVKNSLGQTRPIEVGINPARFAWVDVGEDKSA